MNRSSSDDTLDTLDADVVVVGARCAGAATAMLLAAAGHDVLLVDRATFPSDTLSTHAIARSGVVQLKRWGLLPAVLATGAPPIRDVEFHVDGSTISRTIKEHVGVDLLVAPRRSVLDALLVEEAQRAGARVVTGVRVDFVRRDATGRVNGVLGSSGDRRVSFGSRFVVGADGLRSRVARLVEAPYTEVRRAGSGAAHYAYFAGDWPAMEYYIGDRSFAGIFPTNNGEACIWVCSPSEDAERIRRSHRSVDDAAERHAPSRLARAGPTRPQTATRTSRSRGIIGQPNYVRHPIGPGWALVGDAGYHRDAITGHGISDAFRDAELVATALDRVLRGCADEASAAGCVSRRTRRPAAGDLRDHLRARHVSARRPLHRAAEAARPRHRQPGRRARRPPDATAARGGVISGHTTSAGSAGNPERNLMTITETPSMRNGVDTATLFATLDAVKQAPAAAQFQFRASNEWVSGTHNRSTINGFFGVGQEQAHERTFVFDADHPAVLVGKDNGPTPVEYVLHSLAACLTAGLANIAAARKITLTEVRSTVTGDIDLNGILGLDPSVRNGYQQINVRFEIEGDASPEVLRELVEQSRARSAVYDIVTNGVTVVIDVV